MSVSRKIFIITFLISSIAIISISTLTLSRTSVTLRELAQQRLQESVSREARIIASLFDVVRSDLQMLAEQIRREVNLPSDIGHTEIIESVSTLLHKRPAYLEVRLQIPGETSTIEIKQPENIPYKTRYAMDGIQNQDTPLVDVTDMWPGRIYFSQVTERDGPDIYRPKLRIMEAVVTIATENRQQSNGIITLSLDFDTLITGFGRPRNDISFFISDRDGAYLHRPSILQSENGADESVNVADEFGVQDRWQHWLHANNPQLRFEDLHRKLSVAIERVILSDPMGETARILAVGGMASFSDIEENIRTYRTQLVLIALGVGALLSLALALATIHLTRPIRDLTQIADRIAAGERNLSSNAVGRRDEFGVLARAIMRMLDALRNSAKHEEQAALGRMATMVAHDIRNALSSVKINLQMLHTHHSRRGEDFTEDCSIALGQISYMECILTDMLDFAHPHSLVMDWVDLGDIIKVATLSILPEMSAKSIVFHYADEKLPKIFGDRTRLIQVFQNLLSNAIQSMDTGGHLSIDAKYTFYQSCPAVDIVTTDDGSGISDEISSKIFEPFFTTRAKGTGLGLTIVRRIVINHGGNIYFEANPSGGTIVHVVLPLSLIRDETSITDTRLP